MTYGGPPDGPIRPVTPMTRSENKPASRLDPTVVDEELLDEESRRAWTEAMSVRPFGDSYLVSCPDGTEFVSLGETNCSCEATADVCKHVRRVAIEINRGRVPPPEEDTVPCRACDAEVPVSVAEEPPFLCRDCDLEPGDIVIDTEGCPDTPLLVVSSPGRAAEMVALPGDDRTVAEYPGNGDHPRDAPVVEAIYPQAVSTDRSPRRYLFPVTRLTRPEDRDPQRSLADSST